MEDAHLTVAMPVQVAARQLVMILLSVMQPLVSHLMGIQLQRQVLGANQSVISLVTAALSRSVLATALLAT